MKNVLFLLALTGLIATSCSKSSTDPAVQTKTQLITRTWQMQMATATLNSTGLSLPVYTKGASSNLADFSKYQLALSGDGKFSLADGTQTQTGTWQLLSNDTQLVLTFSDGSKTTYAVDTASATNLDLNYQILPTTQNVVEKGYLAQVQAFGQDISKGLKIAAKLVPQ